MNKVVIDLEATCSDVDGEIPRHESEIIQIGAVLVVDGKIINRFMTHVKPVIHRELTPFCKSLTGITQSEVLKAPLFRDAMAKLDSWLESLDISPVEWGSWGDYDRNQFIRELNRNKIESHISTLHHTNFKKMFGKAHGVKPMGLGAALRLEGLKFEGKQHDALADAENIARLSLFLLETK